MIEIELKNRGRRLNVSVWSRWLASLSIAMAFLLAASSLASAETRTLKLYFIHTKERAEITFKRNGRYDQSGLQKINRFLRDWRRNEPTKMDPRLLDLVWEAYKQTGSNEYINVVSAYRSPATNGMLRSRSKGVAKKSQHMLGKAMDFYIPGVKLSKLRAIGLKMQGGGVGYYPSSGSPFVHFDVGNVRHWPKMSRRELVALFPNGKTLHVPSDGKPLPGFEQAVASYQSRKKNGALAIASVGGGNSSSRSGGLLAAFFGGGGADEEEESGGSVAVASAPAEEQPVAKPKAAAKAGQQIRVVPPEMAGRADIPGIADPEPVEDTPETIIAALPSRSVPLPGFAPRPKADVGGGPLVDLNEPAAAPLVDLEQPAANEPTSPAEIALGIPLPTRRPDHEPAPVVVATNEPALLALASADPDAGEAVPMPSVRPGEVVVASLPTQTDAVALPEAGPFPSTPEEIIAQPKGGRVAAASPRSAIAGAPGTDPAAAMGTGVKTTSKAARARQADSKPEPKPVVIAAQPQSARWALDGEYVARNVKGTRAPSFAYNIVRTAPREVYTAGFQQGSQASDANKFSGKAVQFLSVARFN